MVSGCVVGATWPTLGARIRGPATQSIRGVLSRRQDPAASRGGAACRGHEAVPLGTGRGSSPRKPSISSELGTEWTLRIGDSRHLLRPEEHHSFLFMFIEGGILWFRFLIGGITNAVCFLL